MLGSNTERTIHVIDKIIQATAKFDISAVSYRITTTLDSDDINGRTGSSSSSDSHTHSDGSLRVSNRKSSEDPNEKTIDNIIDIKQLKAEYDSIVNKIQLIDKNIYVRNDQMHNSIGSPYTEMYRLQNILNDLVTYSATCKYIGEYVEQTCKIVSLISRTMQLAVDAKWAIIIYSDYLERGYNYVQHQDPATTR